MVDSLFFALSLSTQTWEDGASIGLVSLVFSVLELLTELQYYAAEARANMVTNEEEAVNVQGTYSDSLQLINHVPSVYAFGDAEGSRAAHSRGGVGTDESV